MSYTDEQPLAPTESTETAENREATEAVKVPETPETGVAADEVKPGKAAKRAAKKAAKKEAKRKRRAERKAAYQALSGGKKFLRWVLGIVLGLAALALVAFLGYQLVSACITSYMENKVAESLTATANPEDILKYAPIHEEGAARVAATEAFDPDDTWVVYLYLCGSNLESMGRNRLSDTTAYYVNLERSAYTQEKSENTQRLFHTFIDEMQAQGMSLPDYLFLPTQQEYGEGGGSEEESTKEGYATTNLRSLFNVELPENVSFVIQTGGSNSWSMTQINPNASQRFLYNQDGFTELSSVYPQNMGSSQTFADFLGFCQTAYPADHEMLLIWNHGGGVFGFCNDEIYDNDGITLPEMKEALGAVYGEKPAEPPFELVGFDACLMASTEVAEALHGYTRYLAASEETEMGDGWIYDKWVGELAAHPEMNGAQLGKVIADSFVENCANFSLNLQWLNIEAVATFSVIDVEKAHSVYEAYTALCAAALADTAQNPWPLAALGRAASKSIHYAGSGYKYFNTLDLGTFMQNLAADYPEETAAVLSALNDAVLYHRETSYAKGSEGLSIYFPTNVDSLIGLIYYLEYLDTVCTDPDMKALYYYKIAGCLNEDLQAYAASAGYGPFSTLDTTPLDQLAMQAPDVCPDNTLELPIGNEAAVLIQDMTVAIAKSDEEGAELCFYGDDAYLYLDEYRTLRTTFNGNWVMLDGHVLPLEIIDQTDDFIRYRTPIKYNDAENAYLVTAYDFYTGGYSILGVQAMDEEADTFGRNLMPVEVGSRIAIQYRMETMEDESIREEYADAFTFGADSKVEAGALENGTYYMAITITDTRGDSYYPALVSFRMENGAMTDLAVSEELGAMASAE